MGSIGGAAAVPFCQQCMYRMSPAGKFCRVTNSRDRIFLGFGGVLLVLVLILGLIYLAEYNGWETNSLTPKFPGWPKGLAEDLGIATLTLVVLVLAVNLALVALIVKLRSEVQSSVQSTDRLMLLMVQGMKAEEEGEKVENK